MPIPLKKKLTTSRPLRKESSPRSLLGRLKKKCLVDYSDESELTSDGSVENLAEQV